MTTIILHGDKIAIDSFINNGSIITCTNRDKRIFDGGAVFFVCGAVSDEMDIVNGFFGREYNHEACVSAYVRYEGINYDCGISKKHGFWSELIRDEGHKAMGSGGSMAIAAMDAGASMEKAMEIVSVRDPWTGGEIHIYDLRKFDNGELSQ